MAFDLDDEELEATRQLHGVGRDKTADEMFEELGYEMEIGTDYIKYQKKVWDEEYQDIVFDLRHNLLNTKREDIKFYRTITSILNTQELTAIIKKVQELGWST